jgi:hypothetical protein
MTVIGQGRFSVLYVFEYTKHQCSTLTLTLIHQKSLVAGHGSGLTNDELRVKLEENPEKHFYC